MAIDKEALTAADHHVDVSEQTEQQVDTASAPGDVAVESRGRKLLRGVAYNMHYLTFLPLIIMSVLQDINLLVAAIISAFLVTCILILSYICYRAGVVKVFPKPFDCFNWCLYNVMIILAAAAHDWLQLYVGLIINAANAVFMWSTILLPCTDNFVMHSIRDRVPPHVARLPLMRRMAFLIALTWAVALTIMTVGAIIPIVAKLHPTEPGPANIIATYVLGFGPLLLAMPIQNIITHVYRKRMMQQLQAHRERQEREAAAMAAAAAPGVGESTDAAAQAGAKSGDDAV